MDRKMDHSHVQTFKVTEKEHLLSILRLTYLSRYTDEKTAKLAKQNKGGTFQLSSAGHELVGIVCAKQLIPGKDWGCPYYRDQPFALGIGCDLVEIFGAFLARAVKNHSGGRMMPNHFSDKNLRLMCQSSVVGSQFLHAAGRAFAIKSEGKDEVVYVSAGEGATSQGDFHEAVNFAALHHLPVIFVIQNNGYAISVPVSEQTAGGSIASIARGYKDLTVHEVDGTDYESLTHAMSSAVLKGRKGEGPSLILAAVPRLAPHSSSDDPSKYKSGVQVEDEKKKDPLIRFENYLLAKNVIDQEELEELKKQAFESVEMAAEEAEKLPFPEQGSGLQKVFAPYEPPRMLSPKENGLGSEKIVIMDAISHALTEEMELDPNIVVFGQDVAHGKGGVFGITRGLTAKFGDSRCFNTPLAESTIIGIAIGMAFDGNFRPVAEIQFADYLWTGINQLFNEAASIYYRSNGEFSVPIVIRMPYGGYIQGGPYHSQSIEGFLAHCPGLKVVIPSNAYDAKGLLKTAIRDPNPVLFLEHKALYRQQKYCARQEPSKEILIPFGEANIVREGSDITVVCYGMMVVMAAEVAEKLAQEGISVEIIDLRTLVPLDMATIVRSVEKTGKLLIVHEAPKSGGFGAEISARIAEHNFEKLDAPISRVGGFESAVPYCKQLENEVLPQVADIERAVRKLAKY